MRQVVTKHRSNPDTVPGMDSGPIGLMRAAVGFQEIQLNIPDDAKLLDVEKTLQLAITGYKRLSEASERLKPIIGRILLVVQERKLWKPDYKNFTEFLDKKVVDEMGLGRSNAFDALRIARAFPTMSNEDYQRYGASRLLEAAKITDEAQEDYKQILQDASKMTVEEFKQKVKEQRPATRPVTFTVSVRVTPEVKGMWTGLVEAFEGTPGDLFKQMITLYTERLNAGFTSQSVSAGARKPAARARVSAH